MQEHTAPADRRPAPEDWFKERRFIEFLKFVLDQPVLDGGKLIQQRRQLKHHSPPTTPQSPSPSDPAQVFPRGTKRVHSGRPRVRNRLRRSLSSRTADRNRERDGLSEPSAYLGHLPHGVVPVRDSKCPQGPTLSLSTDGWDAFVSRVKDAEFPAP
ncbi:DUF397 domain-containing protein [Streptomyces scopuliridis]|uniref:DUF397 domain-containing protein n=1 Tax=Streptomyces scopuliridis TaxID=452529 RepID=UPI000997CBB0